MGEQQLKKELDQIKKIRKQELKQMNVLKKENKAMEDKYVKMQKEKKKFVEQSSTMSKLQKEFEEIKKTNAELIKKQNKNETDCKKMQNTLTAKDNEIRILNKDAAEYKRQIVQIMDLQSQSDKKLFASLQVQTESLKEEVLRYRKDIETLNNKQIDFDALKAENEKLAQQSEEHKKRYLYVKDKLDLITREKNEFESEWHKELENKVLLENECNELNIKCAVLQKQHFEDSKRYEMEIEQLSEQRELDKELDQNKIAALHQKLKRMSVISNASSNLTSASSNLSNQQMYSQQMIQYQQEQYLRQQQWLNYQQQQQQRQYQQMFPPPPQSPQSPPIPSIKQRRASQSSETVGTMVVNDGPNAMSEHGFDLDADDRNLNDSESDESESEETDSDEYSDESATDSYSQSETESDETS